MAFNKEWMITWDELAPSLQSLFKDLQTQITENTNNIQNIIVDIKNINNTITKIQGDITNINTTVNNIQTNIQNITKDVEEIKEKGMFLNMAPKIGYYQNDTVQVLASYNMNSSPDVSNNNLAYYCVTHNGSEEVLYYIANQGNWNLPYQMYIASRTSDNVSFSFLNDPVNLKTFGYSDDQCNGVVSCGSQWVIIVDRNGTYKLIHSNGSLNIKDWAITDIDFIRPNSNIYGIRYFPTKNKLVVINLNNTNAGVGNNVLRFEVWDVGSSTKKFNQLVSGFGNCVYIYNTDRWFFSLNKTKTPNSMASYAGQANMTSNNTWWGGGWERPGAVYEYENERMTFNLPDSSMYKYGLYEQSKTVGSNNKQRWIFKVPKSVVDSYSGTIECLHPTTIDRSKTEQWNRLNGLYIIDSNAPFSILPDFRNQWITSYDEIHNYYYIQGTNRNVNYTKQCWKISMDNAPLIRPNPDKGTTEFWDQGNINNFITVSQQPSYNCLQPDASIWGKGVICATTSLSEDVLYGHTKQSGNLTGSPFVVYEYQKPANAPTGGSGIIIEPVPGKYAKCPNFNYSSQWNLAITVLTDGSSISTYTDMKQGNTFDVYKIYDIGSYETFGPKTELMFSDPYSSYSGFGYVNGQLKLSYGGISYLVRHVCYNPQQNYYLVTVQSWFNDKPEKAPYFVTINRSTKKVTMFNKDSLYSGFKSLYSQMVNHSSLGYTAWFSLGNPHVIFVVSRNSVVVCSRFDGENNTYVTYRGEIKFSSDFSSVASSHDVVNNGNQINIILTQTQGRNVWYNQKYGWQVTENINYQRSEISFLSQKPKLPSNLESDRTVYSFEDVLYNYKGHKYYMYLQSAQGLVAYVPNIPIFLGGYFSIIENPIEVPLYPNANNYIYLERDNNDRTKIIASCSTTLTIQEGSRQFSKICIAKVVTDSSKPISTSYYKINIGYNDYIWNGEGVLSDNNLMMNGEDDQIVKIDKNSNSLYTDDNFRTLQITNTTDEFNTAKNNPIDMATIFNTWYRKSYESKQQIGYWQDSDSMGTIDSNMYGGPFKEGQNLPQGTANDMSYERRTNGWSLSNNQITCKFNYSICLAFLSPQAYSKNWYLEFVLDRIEDDDDWIGCIVGFTVDSKGVEHTLSFMRKEGWQSDNQRKAYNWCLAYDFFATNNGRYITYKTADQGDVSKKRMKFKIQRSGNTFTAYTSNGYVKSTAINSIPYNTNHTITWTMPTSKPSDWSDEMWSNMKAMIDNGRIGFQTMSMNGTFYITNQNILSDAMIYNANDGKIYNYVNGQWVAVGSFSSQIPQRSWIYNSKTKKLYYYRKDGDIILVSQS